MNTVFADCSPLVDYPSDSPSSPTSRVRASSTVNNPATNSRLNPHTPEFLPSNSSCLSIDSTLSLNNSVYNYPRTTPSTPVKQYSSNIGNTTNNISHVNSQLYNPIENISISLEELELNDLELSIEEEDLGGLLLEFLEWFGVQFDFQTMGLAVAPPPTLPQLPNYLAQAAQREYFQTNGFIPISMPVFSPYSRSPSLIETPPIHGCFFQLPAFSRTLVISDPFYPLMINNIGRSVFAMWRIKMAFAEALQLFKQRSSTAPTLLSRLIHGQQITTNTYNTINNNNTNGPPLHPNTLLSLSNPGNTSTANRQDS
jgi:hypothetical protein